MLAVSLDIWRMQHFDDYMPDSKPEPLYQANNHQNTLYLHSGKEGKVQWAIKEDMVQRQYPYQ